MFSKASLEILVLGGLWADAVVLHDLSPDLINMMDRFKVIDIR